jgi:dTDP-4-dehydrorhamnose reductase
VRIAGEDGGVWHVAGPEQMARTELARRVCRAFDLPEELIIATPTSELGQRAPRPLAGGLLSKRYEATFGRAPIRGVDDALATLRSRLDLR